MDAIRLLKTEHREMKALMKEIEETTDRAVRTRETLLEKMTTALKAHERIEEDIFYPALRQHPSAKDIVLEGYEEHHVVDVLMAELDGVEFDDERWAAKFKVIMENIEHHIEEEEGPMFSKATRMLKQPELDELGSRMEAHKQEVLASL